MELETQPESLEYGEDTNSKVETVSRPTCFNLLPMVVPKKPYEIIVLPLENGGVFLATPTNSFSKRRKNLC